MLGAPPFLSIHIGGGTYWRRWWPEEKYLKICQLFLQHYDGKIFLVGGKDEYQNNERIKNILQQEYRAEERVLNVCGADLNTTANILSISDVFLGNDSGPMHLATAVNTRVIAIFGPSPSYRVNPAAHDERNITISSSLDCAPCDDAKCRLPADKQYSCLTGLPAKMVWEKLRNVLDKPVKGSLQKKF
jgi:ADP-heptose:LPS heptosyltransferase